MTISLPDRQDVPLPDWSSLLAWLRDLEGGGQQFDTYQLSAALALLADAVASPDESSARTRFWHRLVPILAISSESAALLRTRISSFVAPIALDTPRENSSVDGTKSLPAPSPGIASSWWILIAGLLLGAVLWISLLQPNPDHLAPSPADAPSVGDRLRPANQAPRPAEPRYRFAYDIVAIGIAEPNQPALLLAQIATVLAPLLIGGGAIAFRVRRRRARLAQFQSLAVDPDLLRVKPQLRAQANLFSDGQFREATRNLRQPMLLPSRDIDIKKTVDLTARKGGMLTPVERQRRQLPEYVALIERLASKDHLAALHRLAVRRIESEGVAVSAYHYASDPRVLVSAPSDGRQLQFSSIEQMSSMAVGQRLIVLGSSSAFLNPLSRLPQQWIALFDPWRERALLDPRPQRELEAGHVELMEEGWFIGRAKQESLKTLANRLSTERSELRNLDNSPLPATRAAAAPTIADSSASEIEQWRPLATLAGHTGPVNSAAFSPDGSRIVTASGDNTARLWDAATGRPLATLEGHTGLVFTAAFSPDGSRIVTASDDLEAIIWSERLVNLVRRRKNEPKDWSLQDREQSQAQPQSGKA